MFCHECGARKAEDGLYCANCGTPLAEQPEEPQALQTRRFNPAPAQPAKRGRLRLGVLRLGLLRRGPLKGCLMVSGALFALMIGCAGVAAIVADDDEQTAVASRVAPDRALADQRPKAAPGAEADDRAIAEEEAVFIRTVESFSNRYAEAENELQRSAQRAKRRAALAQLLPDRAVQGWTGTLESMDTDSRSNAYITITPDGAESIAIATWNNALADAGTHSMIRSGSALYTKLAGMRAGARVSFSGTFAASEVDHIAAGSLTEAGSMTEPAFVMVFSDVTEQE